MSGNKKTLELSTDYAESSYFGGNESIIGEVVRYVRQKNGLNDNETLGVRVKSTHKKKGNEFENNSTIINKIDMRAPKLHSESTGPGYLCKQCNLRYKHKQNFDAHMETHANTKLIHIETANELSAGDTYKNIIDGEIHSKNITDGDGEVHSKNLKKRNSTKQKNHDKKKHACDICGRCFNNREPMIEHRRIHTGEKPFICQVCGKPARTHAILYSHLKLHSDERPYSCQICQKTFKYSHALSRHKLIHTGERNYVCEVCGKRFASSGDIRSHKITHSGLKPYQCPICDLTFNQKRYLKKHLCKRHGFELKAACTIVKKIIPHETEPMSTVEQNQHHIPVNETVETLNVVQNVQVAMNETEEALQYLKSVEIHQAI